MKQQPYDGSLKAILKEDVPQIIPLILPGATFLDILDIEVLRSPMRADRAYKIRYRQELHVLNLEVQADTDRDIVYRLLVYHAALLYDHKLPVISIVIYLFRSQVPSPPLQVMSQEDVLLIFHYRLLCLWDVDARPYVEAHEIGIYTLLPAMKNADEQLLLQAIDELIEYYRDSEAALARRLLWLGTILRRSDTVRLPEKQRLEARLSTFEHLLEQDDFVRRQRALGEAQGKAIGEAQGKTIGTLQTTRQLLLAL
ncbi:MAG TPA: hypothetical protein VKX46_19785, partial [Ktedonobacteraceae bacterium]|nr:hypothetical protein [Ktedonobacteraceae bacterium]